MGRIMIKIMEAEGICIAKHKQGDCFIQENEITIGGLCSAAYNTLYPYIVSMMYDARPPYMEEGCKLHIRCPDPYNKIVFELIKLDS